MTNEQAHRLVKIVAATLDRLAQGLDDAQAGRWRVRDRAVLGGIGGTLRTLAGVLRVVAK